MQITLIGPSYKPLTTKGKDGGIERVVEQLAVHFANSGHTVILFGSGDSDEALMHHPEIQFRVTTEQSLFSRYPDPMQKPFRDKKMTHVVASIVKELKGISAGVIHNHESLVIGAGGVGIRNMLSTTHNCLLPGHAPDRAIFARHKNHPLVTISHSQQADLAREYFGVVHNGIPVSNFTFRQKQNAGHGAYMAWIGRMRSIKGAAFAIRVAAKLGIRLRMAGAIEPDHGEYYEKIIRPLLKKHRGLVEYVGQVNHEEKNELLGGALLTICPYGCENGGEEWNEAFGLVYIESLACGTPVLAYNKASGPEIIVHGRTGYLVSPSNGDEEQLIKDFALGARSILASSAMRESARRDAENRWNTSRMGRGYEVLYRRLLGAQNMPLSREARENRH